MDDDAYAEMDGQDECDCEDTSGCSFDCARFIEKEDEAGFDSDNLLYKTGFTKVSKFLAFDLMPNLKIRIHKYLD